MVIAIARRSSKLSKGGLRVISKFGATFSGVTSQVAVGIWLCTSYSIGIVTSYGKVMSKFPAIKASIAVDRFGMIVHSAPSR